MSVPRDEHGYQHVARQLADYLRWWLAAGVRQLPAAPPPAAAESPSPADRPRFGERQRLLARENAGVNQVFRSENAADPAGRAQAALFASPASTGESKAAGGLPEPPDPVQAQKQLEELRREIGDCRRCRLHHGRHQLVFGEGNPAARLVFAGEGPGRDEDASGRPFVGRAGQLLDRIIAAMGYAREECYIGNVVKCRPPDNRVPREDEMLTCGQFLSRQLEIIRPAFIIALGATASRYLIGSTAAMSKLRGRFFSHPCGAEVLPTYHPAYLLRNPAAKKKVWQDVQKVMDRLAGLTEQAK